MSLDGRTETDDLSVSYRTPSCHSRAAAMVRADPPEAGDFSGFCCCKVDKFCDTPKPPCPIAGPERLVPGAVIVTQRVAQSTA